MDLGLPAILFARSAAVPLRGSTSVTVTVVVNAWTGKTSQKQPLSLQKPDPFVTRLSPDQRIFALVCFVMPIFPPLFFPAFFHFPLDFLFADFFCLSAFVLYVHAIITL